MLFRQKEKPQFQKAKKYAEAYAPAFIMGLIDMNLWIKTSIFSVLIKWGAPLTAAMNPVKEIFHQHPEDC